jgi:serine/threonine protein kinase
MLVGRPPFEAKCTKEIFRKMLKGQYIMPKTISPEAQDLIGKLFKLDVDERITIEDIMEHPFVKEEFPVIMRKVETGDLITLGPAPESMEMFLKPQDFEEDRSSKS